MSRRFRRALVVFAAGAALVAGALSSASATSTSTHVPQPRFAPAVVPSPSQDKVDVASAGRDTTLGWVTRGAAGTTIFTRTGDGDPVVRESWSGTGLRTVVAIGSAHDFAFAAADDSANASRILTNTRLTLGSASRRVVTDAASGSWNSQEVLVAANGAHAVVVQHLTNLNGTSLTRTWRHGPSGWAPMANSPAGGEATIARLEVSAAGTAALTWDAAGLNRASFARVAVAPGAAWGTTHTIVSTVDVATYTFLAPAFDGEALRVMWAAGTWEGPHDDPANGIFAATWNPRTDAWSLPTKQTLIGLDGTPVATTAYIAGTPQTTGVTFRRHDDSVLYTGPVLVTRPSGLYTRTTSPNTWVQWPHTEEFHGDAGGGAVTRGASIVAPDTTAPKVTATFDQSGGVEDLGQVALEAEDLGGAFATHCSAEYTPWAGQPKAESVYSMSNYCAWGNNESPPGSYTITGTFSDNAGNTTTRTESWTIGTRPTTPPVTPPGTGTTPPDGGTTAPTPEVAPTIRATNGHSVLGPNKASGRWVASTNLSQAQFVRRVTVRDARRNLVKDAQVTSRTARFEHQVKAGQTVCVTTYAKNATQRTATTRNSCQTGRLDARKGNGVKTAGNTRTVKKRAAHGRSVLSLSPKKGKRKNGTITVKVAKGATIRVASTGAGKAHILVPGNSRTTLTGTTAKKRTFTAKRAGTLTIKHTGKGKKPFRLDSFTITYR